MGRAREAGEETMRGTQTRKVCIAHRNAPHERTGRSPGSRVVDQEDLPDAAPSHTEVQWQSAASDSLTVAGAASELLWLVESLRTDFPFHSMRRTPHGAPEARCILPEPGLRRHVSWRRASAIPHLLRWIKTANDTPLVSHPLTSFPRQAYHRLYGKGNQPA